MSAMSHQSPPSYEETVALEALFLEKQELALERKRLIEATAELEKLKKEMEEKMEEEKEKIQKEKEEKEKEVKMKVESKIRAEIEEKQEKEKIDKIKKDKHQKIVDKYVSEQGQYPPTYEYITIYLKFIQENQVIYSTLKYVDHPTGSGSYRSYNWLYISDERVGVFCISTDFNKAYLVEDRPFYFFDSELTKDHIRILDQIMYIPTWDNYYNHEIAGNWRHQGDARTKKPISSLHERVIQELAKIQSVRSFGEGECIEKDHSSLRKFESIIKLIPGGYKNGSWRPLDGFFGVYLNEATMDLSELVPVIDTKS